MGDQLHLEQRELVAMFGKRAMKAHMDTLQAVKTSCFALVTEVECNEARDHMANELTQKQGYQRACKDKYPTVALVAEIPNELAMPWSSRFAQEGDASSGQSYLIYQDDTPDFKMAVFASPGLYAPSSLSGLATLVQWAQEDAPILTLNRPPWAPLRQFVRKMVALCMLSVDHVLKAFKLVCTVPLELDGNEECPCRDTPHAPLPLGMEDKLSSLRAYFEKNWIWNQYGFAFWNYQGMGGPRTTNHAESWHNSLKDKFDGMKIDLGVWLKNFQTIHHHESEWARHLVKGLAQPHRRRLAYLQNDTCIAAANVEIFSCRLGLYDASTGALLPVGGTMPFSWKESMCFYVVWAT
uniref:Uncharacterized protein n=1 Tax=Plectus sambesii TaxID=2011161 RepID=A0A914UJ40_9BILA